MKSLTFAGKLIEVGGRPIEPYAALGTLMSLLFCGVFLVETQNTKKLEKRIDDLNQAIARLELCVIAATPKPLVHHRNHAEAEPILAGSLSRHLLLRTFRGSGLETENFGLNEEDVFQLTHVPRQTSKKVRQSKLLHQRQLPHLVHLL